ncbi:MAG: bifunctional oligoribonuclease/PAP phosphatase NrnA [Ignavibacteriales bacterium]|nr:bifunctional oligoribonuclease/PAP phosphatase NrnA [Ignavibacteriales bacterium]
MLNLQLFQKIISENNSFILTTHVNPDGDGLGSELAMKHFLQKMGKSISILNHSETPKQYDFLDKTNSELLCFDEKRDATKISSVDCIMILDTNQGNRLRSMEQFVKNSSATKVIVDHHLEPEMFADEYFIDDGFSSTGEIVFNLLDAIREEKTDVNFDKQIATELYIAIMTDTGSFRFPRTNIETHLIIAELLSYGVDPTEAFANVYERWSKGRMILLGKALDEMKFAFDNKLAYIVCTKKMFEETQTNVEETDSFTTFPMSIEGVLGAVLINELDNGVKISFRSKGNIPFNELAKEYNGGGHKNAAGTRVHNVQLNEIVKDVIAKAEKYLKV